MDFNFEINGINAFNSMVNKLPDALADKVYPYSLNRAAQVLKRLLIAATPNRSGLTRKAFGVFKKKVPGRFTAGYGVGPYRKILNKPEKFERKYKQSFYATAQREGLKPRKARKKSASPKRVRRFMVVGWLEKGTVKQNARPYLQRIISGFYNSGHPIDIIGNALSIGLQRQAAIAAGKVKRKSR
jgi:hypothetical protein